MHARGEAEPSDPAEYEKAKRDLNDFVDIQRRRADCFPFNIEIPIRRLAWIVTALTNNFRQS
jgi:hypothetical protein